MVKPIVGLLFFSGQLPLTRRPATIPAKAQAGQKNDRSLKTLEEGFKTKAMQANDLS
jgi:hypothetical protein